MRRLYNSRHYSCSYRAMAAMHSNFFVLVNYLCLCDWGSWNTGKALCVCLFVCVTACPWYAVDAGERGEAIVQFEALLLLLPCTVFFFWGEPSVTLLLGIMQYRKGSVCFLVRVCVHVCMCACGCVCVCVCALAIWANHQPMQSLTSVCWSYPEKQFTSRVCGRYNFNHISEWISWYLFPNCSPRKPSTAFWS